MASPITELYFSRELKKSCDNQKFRDLPLITAPKLARSDSVLKIIGANWRACLLLFIAQLIIECGSLHLVDGEISLKNHLAFVLRRLVKIRRGHEALLFHTLSKEVIFLLFFDHSESPRLVQMSLGRIRQVVTFYPKRVPLISDPFHLLDALS